MKTKTNKKSWTLNLMKTLFQWLHWKHFNQKAPDGKTPYYEIIEIKSWNAALVDTYYGQRSKIIFL
ncbi:MAG: hypothetical protein WCO66_00770 [Candidatus Absconditabacteria bacterium]